MIRIVVTGSECTGKTTLAEALANHYRTRWTPEYVRIWVEGQGRPPEYRDVDAIAHGQIALEDSLAADTSTVIVQDCDLLSTIVYSRHYFGDCPPWIEQALTDRLPNLYLLAGIDVPWRPDRDQRDRGNRREEMHELFRHALKSRDLGFCEIHGSRRARLDQAIAQVEKLLGRGS